MRIPYCFFFVCLPSPRCHKQKGVRISPCTNFLQCLFLHVRTLQIQFRKRVISQNACIFTFWDLILTSKLKNLSPVRYKIILPLMVRTYEVLQKLFLFNPGAQVLIQTRTYVCWKAFLIFYIPPVRRVWLIVFKKGKWRKISPETIHYFKA